MSRKAGRLCIRHGMTNCGSSSNRGGKDEEPTTSGCVSKPDRRYGGMAFTKTGAAAASATAAEDIAPPHWILVLCAVL